MFSVLLMILVSMFVGVAAHEAGHWFAASAFGYKPKLRVRPTGVMVVVQVRAGFPARHDVLIAAAGPAASVLAGAGGLMLGFQYFADFSIILGLVSLIPVRPQDGWRIWMQTGKRQLPVPAKP